jgi:hypothetical protein
MKKIALTSLLAVFAVSAADASVFDPIYRAKAGQWAGQFGVAFTSGANEDGDGRTDLTAGDFNVSDVKIAYGVSDVFALTFETYGANSSSQVFANPEIGLNYRLLNDQAFGLDIVAKYGIALTETAVSGTRIGNNNLQAGVRVFGEMDKLQWGARLSAQYVFEEPDDYWNMLAGVEAQYSFNNTSAVKAELSYDVLAISEDIYSYDRSLSLGYVHNFSETAAVQPYVAYHFQRVLTDGDNELDLPNNYWQIGAKFGVQF